MARKVGQPAQSGSKVVQGNPEKLRCPRCKNEARLLPDGRGGKIYQCVGCGRKFSS